MGAVIAACLLYFLGVFFRLYQHIRGVPMNRHGWVVIVAAGVIHGYLIVTKGTSAHLQGFEASMALLIAGLLLAAVCFALEVRYGDSYFSILGFPIVITLLIGGFSSERLLAGPNFRGSWFFAHVLASISGEVFFLLAGIAGATYLFQVRRLKAKNRLRATLFFPPLTRLDLLLHRFALAGFVFFSAGLFLGAVWSYKAQGSIPLTGFKQVVSALVWLVFAALLGGRTWRGLAGPGSARLAVAGCVIGFLLILGTGSTHHWLR